MPKTLTELMIPKLPEGTYYDSKVSALGLRVGKRKTTWFVVCGHNRTKERLGHYPYMSLSEARNASLRLLMLPTGAKPQISFNDARNAFLGLSRWRPQTERVLRSNLSKFAWSRALNKITHEDVVTALDRIPHPSARFHAYKDLKTFFNWCVPRYLDRSPCEGITMPKQPSRDRVLTTEELRSIWAVLTDHPADTILRIAMLTGQRRGEIKHMRIDGDLATIDGRYTKNKRTHTFPVGTLTLQYWKPVQFSGWSHAKKRVDTLSGVSDWVIHDLRRTYASTLAQLGVPIHIIEKLLNHVSGSLSGVAGVYNRYSYLDEMKEAVTAYEEWFTKQVLMGLSP